MDAARVRIPPPLVFVSMMLVGAVWQAFVLDVHLPVTRTLRVTIAVVVGLLSASLAGWAHGYFRRTGQDARPWKPTPSLILDGPYRFTRNPMYVAMLLLQIAIGIGVDVPWTIAFAPLSLLLVHFLAVRPEEAYLEDKFGDEYRRYKSAVRRYV